MLPPMYHSCTRKRLLIHGPKGWMGRDLTGNALEKWLTYDRQHYLHHWVGSSTTIVVEDTFSYYKVIWALPHVNVMCALGSSLRDTQLVRLLGQAQILLCFDGDEAGYSGAADGVQRIRALGVPVQSRCAPEGKDPKDLSAAELNQLLEV